jgi:hypothetical protein
VLAKKMLYPLIHGSSPFSCVHCGAYGDSQTICLGWPRISILLISVSQVARIIGGRSYHYWQESILIGYFSVYF